MNSDYTQLQKKIREVRSRLKWIVGAKGVAISLGCTLFTLFVATISADHWNYNHRAVTLARWFSVVSVVVVFYRFVAKPLWTKIDDLKIARYIEERHPTLQDRLVSAIELGQKESGQAGSQSILPLLFKDALQRIHPISPKSLFNPREPFLSSTLALVFIICFILMQMFGPNFFQYATLKLYANWLIPQAVTLYRIELLPGNSEIRKGSDQKVTARLVGFDSSDVNIYSRRENSASWEQNHMEPEQHSSRFEFLFLDINEKVHYYAQSGNVRSPEFAISVRDIAQVKRIDLTYHYPQYTGIPART
jgi:hypothetical protein